MSETYISPTAPSLKMRLKIDDKDVNIRFKDKQLIVTDVKISMELDRLREKSPHVSQLIQKVDIEAAEKLALAHKQMVLDQNKGVTGSMAADMNPATMAKMQTEVDRMRTAGVAEEVITELMSDIKVNREKIDELLKMSDAIPGAIGAVEPEEKEATPSNVFAVLAKK